MPETARSCCKLLAALLYAGCKTLSAGRKAAQNAPVGSFRDRLLAALVPAQFQVRTPEAMMHSPHGGFGIEADCSTDGPWADFRVHSGHLAMSTGLRPLWRRHFWGPLAEGPQKAPKLGWQRRNSALGPQPFWGHDSLPER
eukprot:2112274-Alexandrium_andersonii.AAC.1